MLSIVQLSSNWIPISASSCIRRQGRRGGGRFRSLYSKFVKLLSLETLRLVKVWRLLCRTLLPSRNNLIIGLSLIFKTSFCVLLVIPIARWLKNTCGPLFFLRDSGVAKEVWDYLWSVHHSQNFNKSTFLSGEVVRTIVLRSGQKFSLLLSQPGRTSRKCTSLFTLTSSRN